MIELLTNMIVVTALGGALTIVVLVVVKALISLAAAESSEGSVSEKVCRYCGAVLAESKCDYCGAVNQARKKPKP